MILDERTEFADALALGTAGTGRQNVGDQIPLSVARNISAPGNRPLYLVIQVTTAPAGGNVSFELISDTSNPPLVDGTATVHAASKVFTPAQLPAGTQVVIPLPGEPPSYETILGVQANVSGAALSAGAINAFLTPVVRQWKAYADGVV